MRKVNTVGITLVTTDGLKSIFYFPPAKLIDYDGKFLTIYERGERNLTEQEREILADWQKIEDDYYQKNPYGDAYWKKKEYFKNCPYPWLNGYETVRGKYYKYKCLRGKFEQIKMDHSKHGKRRIIMKNTTVLQMINDGEIETLKKLLMQEIYENGLKDGNAKTRCAAMKKYFKYVRDNMSTKLACKMPCKDVEVYNKKYNAFVDGYSFVLTTENIGVIESFDKTKMDYLNVESFYDPSNIISTEKINLNDLFAYAKSEGYKLTKKEFDDGKYFIKYKDAYYSCALFDKAYSIINDGEPAEVDYKGNLSILYIHTSIGVAGVLPVRPLEAIEDCKIVIDTHKWEI